MEMRKRWIEKDGDLSRKHTVLNEKLKRRIEKTGKENQQTIGAVSNGLSTTVYRTTMVKFLLSRGASST
jgi:hypothetical protein